MTDKKYDVVIAGAGLAGSEAAYQLAKRGFKIKLIEMRPKKTTPAHTSDKFGELVCSNSLKAQSLSTSSGLLKEELLKYGSFLIDAANRSKVPAGDALAVDREIFSQIITDTIKSFENIDVVCEELKSIDEYADTPLLIATGPLTSDILAENIKSHLGGALYFADAISPIIDAESIDYSKGYFMGRYNKGGDDYFNIPLSEDEYNNFYDALISADFTKFHGFEDISFFEGCMPIEAMAERGRQTLAFGPMKPVGLENPETGEEAYAVIQLRKENACATAFNIVGFQTKMTIASQQKVFRLIPALKNCEFLRYGSVHRNTFIRSPKNLNRYFQMVAKPNVFFAGQVTGVEGYVESIASGLVAALQISKYLSGEDFYELPRNTAVGSLCYYISGESGLAHANEESFVPSNFHFGMLLPPEKRIRKKSEKKLAQSKSALEICEKFVSENLK